MTTPAPVLPRLPLRKTAGDTARRAEIGLWLVSAVCAAVLATTAAQSLVTHRAALAITPAQIHTQPQFAAAPDGDGALIGRLDIPALHLSVPILENYGSASLKRGVGHIPGTALPGGLGNLGLAGHRDTYFRPLRGVHTGMKINVVTPGGTYAYAIESTEIVNPDQVEVLDIRTQPELTLITCYPFDFIGAAPRRFIVHARLLSLDPA